MECFWILVQVIFMNSLMNSCLVNCHSIEDVHNLKDDLFKNKRYDPTVRPLVNQSEVLKVNISLFLNGIYDIDLNNGHMPCKGYLNLGWIDEQLTWNRSQYGGLDVLGIASGTIWTPVLSQFYDLSEQLPFSMTWVASTGKVFSSSAGEVITLCDLDMTLYPFDKHTCAVHFMSSRANGAELLFVSTVDHIELDNYETNGKWKVLHTEASVLHLIDKKTGIPYNFFRCTISIQRRPYFILLHTSLPLIFLLFLNLFVFYVPIEGGERVSFSSTIFLTLIFFSINISDGLPQTSTHISFTSINIFISTFTSGMAVVASIILCKLAEESDKSIQPWLRKLTLMIIRFRCRKQRAVEASKSELDVTFISTISLKPGNKANNSNEDHGSSVSDINTFDNDQTEEDSPTDEESNLTRKQVADNLDYAFFIVAITWYIIFSAASGTLFMMAT